MVVSWRQAMADALYGPDGFFLAGGGPAAHFRTSVHASPVFGSALLRLLDLLDTALGHPDPLDVVDVGAGRGELLTTLATLAPPDLAGRLRLTGVELAPRPGPLPTVIGWRADLPTDVTGLLLGTEWLDNVPLDVATAGLSGWRQVMVDPRTGVESIGGPVDPADTDWLTTWWPTPADARPTPADARPTPADARPTPTHARPTPADARPASPGGPIGTEPAEIGPAEIAQPPGICRAEIGRARDAAWSAAVAAVRRGLAVAVDYGHLRADRPSLGTLTGFRAGRQVPPVPDTSCDLTAHVAMDSVAAAGSAVAGLPYQLVSQRAALREFGADGRRPSLELAATDPAAYVRALAAASAAAELTDPAGLGGHWWLLQPVGVDPTPFMARWRA